MSAAPDMSADPPMGLAEWDALPWEQCRWWELVEGVPHVSPAPVARHQRVAVLVVNALNAVLPPDRCAVMDVEVMLEGGPRPTVRVPDVAVIPTASENLPRREPADVLAVVEVHSPGTRRVDRMHKMAEYAEAGIAHYALVEPGPPVVLTEMVLDGGAYRVRAEHRGAATVDLGVAASIDLDALDGTAGGAAASNQGESR